MKKVRRRKPGLAARVLGAPQDRPASPGLLTTVFASRSLGAPEEAKI